MLIKTGLRSGELAGAAVTDAPTNLFSLSSPFINKWQTCYRCKGLKDQYGNVSNATCGMCWPMGSPAPI